MLQMIASTHINRGEISNAQRLLQEALACQKEVEDKKSVKGTLVLIINLHLVQKETEDAQSAVEELLGMFTEEGDKKGEASTRHTISQLHLAMHGFDEAMASATEALEIFRGLEDRDGEVAVLITVANVHLAKDDSDEALRVAGEIRTILSSEGERRREAASLLMIAGIHLSKEEGEAEARSAAEEARDIYHELEKPDGEADALHFIASVHLGKRELSEALKLEKEALSFARKAEDSGLEFAILHTIADIYFAQEGQETDGLRMANEMLALARRVGDRKSEANALHMVARVHLGMNEPRLALPVATEAVSYFRGSLDRRGEAIALHQSALANLALDASNEEGLQLANEAADLFEATNDVQGNAFAMHTVSAAHLVVGNFGEGLRAAKKALELFRDVGDIDGEVVVKETIVNLRQCGVSGKAIAGALRDSRRLTTARSTVHSLVCSASQRVSDEDLEDATSGNKKWPAPPAMLESDPVGSPLLVNPRNAVIWGRAVADGTPTAWGVDFSLFCTAMVRGNIQGVPILVHTRGVHSRMTGELAPPTIMDMSGITVFGLIRTVRLEMPNLLIAMFDTSVAITPAELPRCLMPMLPEVYYYHGHPFVARFEQAPSLFRQPSGSAVSTSTKGENKHRFMRKQFSWTAANSRLDNIWFRQALETDGSSCFVGK